MKKNILIIIIEGKYTDEIINENNYIFISNKEPDENIEKKWLQMNYENPDEIFKSLEIIRTDFGKINEIVIIYNNQKLNMISYQFDYEFLKNIYLNQTANLIYFLSLLIPFFETKIKIKLQSGSFSYYQIHNKNWENSIKFFLECMKKDLKTKIEINLS